jgi:predicted amidohydrolase
MVSAFAGQYVPHGHLPAHGSLAVTGLDMMKCKKTGNIPRALRLQYAPTADLQVWDAAPGTMPGSVPRWRCFVSPYQKASAIEVAAIQFAPVLYDRPSNLQRLLLLLERAFANGARIAVAPEMCTTGYCFYDRADVAPLAETLPGPTTDAVQALCARWDAIAVFGLPEVDPLTGIFYNSVAVVGAGGLLGRYRKIHSFVSEPRWAMDGDLGHVVIATPFGRVGLLDCADIELFEGARVLQILGADLIAFPTNWCGDPAPSPYWWARAWETGLPLIAADRTGFERGVHFAGGSAVFDGDGTLLASQDDGEGIVRAVVHRVEPAGHTAPLPVADCLPLARDTHRFDPEVFFNLYGQPGLPEGSAVEVSALPVQGSAAEIAQALAGLRGRVVVLPGDALRQPWDEVAYESFRALCLRQQLWVCCGSAASGEVRLLGPEGTLLTRRSGQVGTEDAIVNLPGVRVGICRGAELARPETSRLFALEGVDLLLAPDCGAGFASGEFPGSAVPGDAGTWPAERAYYFIPRVRAASDDLVLAYAAHTGMCAVLAARNGHGQVDAGGAHGVVDTRRGARGLPSVRAKPHLRRRRPEHYRPLWTPRS